jgi:putative Mn2+ efflux pump MntP
LGLLELLLLAVGLAMDAFAVSICGSLALAPASRFSGALRFGIWFGTDACCWFFLRNKVQILY